jgi:carbon-monoxide dehydrogenase small subunit
LKHPINLKVNGDSYDLVIEDRKTLLEVLREELGLTGTKEGCDSGDCGACTVIVDGKAVLSCMLLAVEAQGKDITTVEGLAEGTRLHPLQESFLKHNAVQCGYCTPGMLLSAKALLDENPKPGEEDAKTAIAGNLCRCSDYSEVVASILAMSTEGEG